MRAFSPETYEAIFEASPDGIVVVDEGGTIRRVNAAAAEMFGYRPAELLGEPVERLVPEALRGAHRVHRQGYAADPHARPMGIGLQLLGQRRNGSDLPVEISLSPLRLEEGGLLVIATVRDVTQRQRLRDFSAGALRASEEERQRIARELHDDPAQRLAALLVRLRLLGRAANEVEREEQVRDLRRDLEAAADSVRRIARGLRPPELEDAGVVMALRAHARSVEEGTDLELDLDLEPVDHLLTPDAKLVLYRVVQEALSNAGKHAHADRIGVTVEAVAGQLRIEVTDDGLGFDSAKAREYLQMGRVGLASMRERVELANGTFMVHSTPGRGTTVMATLPLESVPAPREFAVNEAS